jgi:hypothetical protein
MRVGRFAAFPNDPSSPDCTIWLARVEKLPSESSGNAMLPVSDGVLALLGNSAWKFELPSLREVAPHCVELVGRVFLCFAGLSGQQVLFSFDFTQETLAMFDADAALSPVLVLIPPQSKSSIRASRTSV